MLSLIAATNAFIAPLPVMHSSIKMQVDAPATISGTDFAKTLPGVTGPFGFFDPLGTVADKTPKEILLYREAEIAHGRVAMMAAVGFLSQEAFHPIFPWVEGPAARQLDFVLRTSSGQVAATVLLSAIFFSEIFRARTGWEDPDVEIRTLREDYSPGDLGFDPLGMKPKDAAGLLNMRNKELNNGRLAMLAVAGMCAQEVATDMPIIGA